MKRIAIIGAGMISNSHAKALKNVENGTLCAIADINKEAADKFAKEYQCKAYYEVETMLQQEKPDGAIICLPTFLHAKYVEVCANYGVNVLCEKPVEMTVEATQKMLDVVDKSGIIFMVAQVVRFWPGYVEIKEMADSGELGDIYMAYASRCSTMQTWGNTWLNDPDKGAGAIQDMHVHDIDYLRHLCGEVDYVYCLGSKDDTKCWNHVMSSLSFKNGFKAVAEASFTMRSTYPFTMSLNVSGTKSTVEFIYRAGYSIGDRDSVNTVLRIFKDNEEPIEIVPEQYDPYEKQLSYFIELLETNKQPEIVPHQQNLDVIKAVCAIRESVDNNKIVHL
jgi:predicted dehydrogenase